LGRHNKVRNAIENRDQSQRLARPGVVAILHHTPHPGIQHDNGWRNKISPMARDAGRLGRLYISPRWPVFSSTLRVSGELSLIPFTGIRRSHQGERLTAFARWGLGASYADGSGTKSSVASLTWKGSLRLHTLEYEVSFCSNNLFSC
jgi:hypothetical protein